MNQIQHRVIVTLEDIKERLEQNDESLLKRERVFAGGYSIEQQPDVAAPVNPSLNPSAGTSKKGDQVIEICKQDDGDLERLKAVSFELLDIGRHYGKQGINSVKSDPMYQQVDKYVKFDEKFEVAMTYGEMIYSLLLPYATQLVAFCQIYITFLFQYLKVIESRLRHIMEQVEKFYACFMKLAEEAWMRLDYDEDGTVSLSDGKESTIKLITFLKNLDYVEASKDIKNRLYTDAIAYMQQELEQNEELAKEKQVKAIPETQAQKYQIATQVK